MDSTAPNARYLQGRIIQLRTTLIKRISNIFEAALDNAEGADGAIARKGTSHTTAAYEQFQIDVEATALVTAAEEVMVLTRSLKDIWLFGGLDTLRTEDSDAGGARPEDVKAVAEYIQKYVQTQAGEEKASDKVMTLRTPPPTTLSTPSPTEAPLSPPIPAEAMPPPSKLIYLIVAMSVKPPLGIGLRGQLPWPPLKADMAFFRRVTSRTSEDTPQAKNAVVMGRKTWESIPRKFRPLKGRINVVITRSQTKLQEQLRDSPEVMVSSSLQDAVHRLKETHDEASLGKTFIIGGSEIYRSAVEELDTQTSLRIIQTMAQRKDGQDIECDTFFPIELRTKKGSPGTQQRQVGPQEVRDWVGEELPQGGKEWLEEGPMQIRVIGWEITKALA